MAPLSSIFLVSALLAAACAAPAAPSAPTDARRLSAATASKLLSGPALVEWTSLSLTARKRAGETLDRLRLTSEDTVHFNADGYVFIEDTRSVSGPSDVASLARKAANASGDDAPKSPEGKQRRRRALEGPADESETDSSNRLGSLGSRPRRSLERRSADATTAFPQRISDAQPDRVERNGECGVIWK